MDRSTNDFCGGAAMKRWYSPRGARRGLLIAGIATVLWVVWALGYVQGVTKSEEVLSAPMIISTPVDASCCLPHFKT